MTNYDNHIALLPIGDEVLAIITETWSPAALILAARIGTRVIPTQVAIRALNPHLN